MKISIFIALLLITYVNSSLYDKYYQEAYTVAASMTLLQKIGQTVQVDVYGITEKNGTTNADAIKYALGSILISGNGCPDQNGNAVNFAGMKEDQIVQVYAAATLQKWKKMADKLQYTINVTANNGKTYKIKPLLGTDAVHGDQHVAGTILFPHNIGLSCSHNAQHFYNTGYWTTNSLKKYGFNYAFAPTVAVSHNPQWGRYYQTMGQQHDKIYQYGKAYTEGLQGKIGNFTGILGSVKHFFGDGATFYGADEGNAQVGSFKTFTTHNIQGYIGSVEAGIGSVMASYSALNFVPHHVGTTLRSILRGEIGFDGFIISDYNQFDKISQQYLPTSFQIMTKNESIASMFAAGVDMFMIPDKANMLDYLRSVEFNLKNDTISMDRLNDAVARILSVKLALGLVDVSPSKEQQGDLKLLQENNKQNQMHSSNEYQDSLDAVHESLVLLKNTNLIPLEANNLQYIVLVGEKIININQLAKNQLFLNYDDIGMQSGGWSARWQGFEGNSIWSGDNKKNTNASSILDGLKNLNKKINLVHPNYTTFTDTTKIDLERNKYLEELKTLRKNMTAKNTIILSVVGEIPYAEMTGDINIPYCQNQTIFGGVGCIWIPNSYTQSIQGKTLEVTYNEFDKKVISNIRQQDKNIPIATVLISGRPMIIDQILNESSAFISAFLPGTSGGQGIVDALFGAYVFRPNGATDKTNTLSFDWPKSMDQLKQFPYYAADGQIPQYADPLFKVGYGLSSVK